ncbi:hypothetical protein FOZ61_004942 [Perkinsus olseni]|uniref:Uncharacterized protein n=1 Tax=Perkinsus olseni TaxID=32597 RepID=A0A7J6MCJ8_PEROL|nr:hypothetical protein FOZ61_004942 [Perkinsus olseni]
MQGPIPGGKSRACKVQRSLKKAMQLQFVSARQNAVPLLRRGFSDDMANSLISIAMVVYQLAIPATSVKHNKCHEAN